MTGLVWVLVIPVPMLLWMLISPRGFWRTLSAWQYKNPEAVEPSEASFKASRVTAGIGLVLLVCFGAWLYQILDDAGNTQRINDYEECLQRERGRETGSLLSAEDWCRGLSPTPER